jgi:hypothetical protein
MCEEGQNMEKLSDFKPLENVILPDIGELNCSGLILIVGPNSSGKSQLLKDLYGRIAGEPRPLVVAREIVISKPEYKPFMKCLEAEGYFASYFDENGAPHLRPLTTYLGSGHAINQIQPNQAESWHGAYSSITPNPSLRKRNEFLNYFGRLLVTGLFLERRLISLNNVGVIDFLNQAPQHDLHALYLNDDAREKLFRELNASFNKAVWPDTSRGNLLCLRVSDDGILPSAEERLSHKKMAEYRTIEDEGDGLKSYVAICISLLLGTRPVCLIDEPEMCLHPPQAYNLGRFIGKNGASQETATFVATHSSNILRGVIQTQKNVQIVRMTRKDGKFSGHLVAAEVLANAIAKPTVRAESVLDGIFAQSVIVLEADGDRLVYQTAWETLGKELRLDVHFAAVGGIGGIADTCNLYRTLNIPVVIIAYLDMIIDLDRLKKILNAMAPIEISEPIIQEASTVLDEIRKLPPNISERELETDLDKIGSMPRKWENQDDIKIRRELNRLSQNIDRMRRLKRGGVKSYPEPVASQFKSLLAQLARFGVFLVPVGELEEWLSAEGITESKENKWAWANAAALKIQSRGASTGDIWDFLRMVGAYLYPSENENSHAIN